MKLEDLRKMVEKEGPDEVPEGEARFRVTVGMGTCGIAACAREVLSALLDELEKRGVADVIVTQAGCRGMCDREPLVYVEPKGGAAVTYEHMDGGKAREVVVQHLIGGEAVAAYQMAGEGPRG
jgi:NADP-reducing hydrogenase subunit HndB